LAVLCATASSCSCFLSSSDGFDISRKLFVLCVFGFVHAPGEGMRKMDATRARMQHVLRHVL
jgi:hypothetical protein